MTLPRKRQEARKTSLSLSGSHQGADASRSRRLVGRPIRGSGSLAGWWVAGQVGPPLPPGRFCFTECAFRTQL